MTSVERDALRVAKEIADRLIGEGAQAVILTGSWARGDAHRESDLDIRAVGEESSKKLIREGGFLVSVASSTKDENLEMFKDPGEVGSIVPGWRSAHILADPKEVAAQLKRRAEGWSWEEIDDDADRYVAKEMTKLAEEVHTLYTNLELGIQSAAAATRSLIVSELVPVMSVDLRLLYESEKELWDSVTEKIDGDWKELQESALGQSDGSFLDSCRAAFGLFLRAEERTRKLLDAEQEEVVSHAANLARGALATGD
jgi:predicted nucleotidyltransferase